MRVFLDTNVILHAIAKDLMSLISVTFRQKSFLMSIWSNC